MKYVNLGNTGLKISQLCLGCMSYAVPAPGYDWTLDEAASRPLLRKAVELGINFFDTANAYSAGTSEEILGRALKDFARRDEVVVATKAFAPLRMAPNMAGLSRKALFAAVDASLKRLGTDYIDLYQIHRWDYNTPIEETMEALHDIVKAGKALYIGSSSNYAWQFQKALYVAEKHGWTRFVSMQNHLNLLNREEEREMLPLCADQGIGVIPWSPLARGRLTRDWNEKTERSESDSYGKMIYDATAASDRKVVEAVSAVAAARGLPKAQIALAWLLGKPGISAPIIGATKPHHLDDAVAALDVKLTPEEINSLEEPYVPHSPFGLGMLPPFPVKLTLAG